MILTHKILIAFFVKDAMINSIENYLEETDIICKEEAEWVIRSLVTAVWI